MARRDYIDVETGRVVHTRKVDWLHITIAVTFTAIVVLGINAIVHSGKTAQPGTKHNLELEEPRSSDHPQHPLLKDYAGACPESQIFDVKTGECVAKLMEHEELKSSDQPHHPLLKDYAGACPESQIFDVKTGECVAKLMEQEEPGSSGHPHHAAVSLGRVPRLKDYAGACPEGQVFDVKTGECMDTQT